MKTNITIKICLSLLLLTMISQTSIAQVEVLETFEGTADANDFNGFYVLWQDGGSRARNDGNSRVNGTNSIRLNREGDPNATTYTTDLPLSGYSQVNISFFFRYRNCETDDNLLVEYSDNSGSSYTTIGTYSRSTLSNDVVYRASITITDASYTFNNNSRFRFRADGNAADDHMFVDDVLISNYCPSYGHTTYDTSITYVDFGSITNASAKPSGYSDYTAQSTTVTQGGTENLTVRVNTDGNYTSYTMVWIDWNQDGDFDDSGESFDMGTATNVSDGATANSLPLVVNVPAGAALGNTRMRVSSRFGGNPTSCETNFDGEVEDYTVNVTAGGPAPEIDIVDSGSNAINDGGGNSPSGTNSTDFGNVLIANNTAQTYTIENNGTSDLTISSITSSNGDFTITGPGSSTITAGSSTTFTVTFTPSSAGTINSIITVNNNDSAPEDVYTFNVEGVGIDPCPSTVSTFPYNEGFESGLGSWIQDTADGNDWIRQTGGTPSSNTGPSGAHEGSYYLFTEGSSPYFNTVYNLISPCFDLTSAPMAEFSFFYHMYGTNMGTLDVEVSTDGGVTYGAPVWTQSGEVQTSNGQAWNQATINLSSYIGQTIKLRFNGTTGGDFTSDMAIDAISLSTTPSPDIDVVDSGGNPIDDGGGNSPSGTNDTDFGTVTTTSTITYTIENNGAATLTISSITSSNGDYTITGPVSSSVSAGGSTTFDVTFTPSGTGTVNSVITINNNDNAPEDVYTFNVTGIGDLPICSSSTMSLPYTESFESGANGWNSGGADASRENIPGFSYDNNYSYRIRSASGSGSSFCSPNVDISAYNKVDFKFFFYADGFETGETFTFEYSDDDGATWEVVRTFTAGDTAPANKSGDFQFGSTSTDYYVRVIGLLDTDYTFTSNARFRFQSIGSDTTDNIYIDNISITGTTYTTPTVGPGGVTSDLSLWLQADKLNGTSVGTDGALVSQWTDTGIGNNASVTETGNEPTYRNSVARNINFNPVVDFTNDNNTASGDMTYLDGREVLEGSAGFNSNDIFMVVMPDTPVSTSTIPLDTFTSFDVTAGNTHVEDVTGFGFGNYSARLSNEIFGYAIGSTSTSSPFPGYGRGVTDTSINMNQIAIINTRHNSTDTDMEIYMNANQIGAVTNDIADFSTVREQRFWLGRSQYWQGSFDGRIAEVITYTARKNDANATQDRNRIQSYLGIKYGITLQPTITAGVIQEGNLDYVDSDGTVIWDESANNGYNYDIAGIGRDDASGLDQRQSSSINSNPDGTGETRGIVTMGLTSIEDTNSENKSVNSSSSFTDKNFIVWGNNNISLDAAPNTVAVDMSANISGLNTDVEFIGMQRIWKVVETGDVSRVAISIPQDAVRNISPPGNYLMFISETGVFTPTAQYRVMTADGSGNLVAEYDFPSNAERFITFGYAPEIIVERSINFDAVAQNYIDVEDNLDLDATSSTTGLFTLSTWIKRESGSTNTSIVSKRDVAYTEGYDLKINASNQVEMNWINGSTRTISSSVAIPENEWHHIAVTHDGTTARLYIDGVLETTSTLPLPLDTSRSFLIGAAGRDGSATAYFDGNIDEVRVWNAALTANQLRFLMNQELEDNAGTIGKYFDDNGILPTKNDASALDFTNLRAYFPMSRYTYTNTNDDSGNDLVGYLRQLRTVDFQTAPLPYISTQNGNWTDASTWTNGSVQTIPGARSLADNDVSVDWNIIQTGHNITIDNTSLMDDDIVNVADPDGNDNEGNRTVLAHILDSGTVTVDGDNTAKTGYGYTVTHYFELNSKIDLEGESQLIQTTNSDLVIGSSGELEKDQQGVTSEFHYNYWGAPVGATSIAPASPNPNRYSYNVTDIMYDNGTGVNFTSVGFNGSNTTPVTIADYWIWKFANNTDGDYSEWEHVRSTGTLLPGEGFTMKGTGTTDPEQNYTFLGKPNNADIDLTISQYNDYLVGNPYASAIDARQFILDNGPTLFFDQGLIRIVLDGGGMPVNDGNGHPIYQDDDGNQYTMRVTGGGTPVNDGNGNPIYEDAGGNPHYAHLDGGGTPILDGNGYMLYIISGYVGEDDATTSGTLYFWEHWGGSDHVLANYQAGYATYNLAGSLAAPFSNAGESDPDVSPLGTGTKVPGRYIPVGQGFFVVADTGGTINFNNGQRVFKREVAANGEFIRSSNTNESLTEDDLDPRQKIKLGFYSAGEHYRRLLLTIDEDTTPDVDWGFDATTYDFMDDDMFWGINNNFYVIQASDNMDEGTSYPLIIYTATAGNNTISIDEMRNIGDDQEIFLHDIELDYYHDLKESNYEIYLDPGYYDGRFEIVFENLNQSLSTDDIINEQQLDVRYANNIDKVVLINPHGIVVETIQIYNILGQHVVDIDEIKSGNYTEYNVGNLSSGPYIIKLNTVSGSVSKKVLVD
ncbi:MAG: choice-of-anchor D domain-containing protein [Winogradskyella sp.]|uniref:LamG-like jellyroll fold domain-containing protein n=1 Tax=Winogradskyella sp. TaxID=1883156 RepID=UPI000F416D3A|nr:LamG-like jellyroll fold domain-containing protein [Winogradskyella sp.]RNC79838.1 MAG: choice-of-anchor D domain-containing protein [Winogradskyella sp.]